jgi:predicted TIM-barrel fold metal-dependent hydrolase
MIDVDGHQLEYLPLMDRYVREEMSAPLFERWRRRQIERPSPLSVRRSTRQARSGWWTGAEASAIEDRAAAMLPGLLRARLDEIGLDFMVIYTSAGLNAMNEPDEELRIPFCRALNRFSADIFEAHADRVRPAAVIPMYSPEEALDAMRHAAGLGLRVAHFPAGVPRLLALRAEYAPPTLPAGYWLDTFGLDSLSDYDPVWRELEATGMPATFHGHSSQAATMKASRSISSYVFNHVGAHAALMHEVCKSLILGGVLNRFPNLRFGFLEGGPRWAVSLFHELAEHWRRRNCVAIDAYDPERLDVARMGEIVRRHGADILKRSGDEVYVWANRREAQWLDALAEGDQRDEFAAAGFASEEDIDATFARIYFGCEADDRTTSWCYRPQSCLPQDMNPMASSDFGHWDVGNATGLAERSVSLLQSATLSACQFRRFSSDNAIRMHGKEFWCGTNVEDYARAQVFS